MLEKLPPRAGKLIDRMLAVRRMGVVPSLHQAYDECVETKLPDRLQRLLDRLDEKSNPS
jgi:hypothetical protein